MRVFVKKTFNILLVISMFFTYSMPVYAVGDDNSKTSVNKNSLTNKVIMLKDNSDNGDFNYVVNVNDSIKMIYDSAFNYDNYFNEVIKNKISDNNIIVSVNNISNDKGDYSLVGYNDSYKGQFTYTYTKTIDVSDNVDSVKKYFTNILGNVSVDVEKKDDSYIVSVGDVSETFKVAKSTMKTYSDTPSKILSTELENGITITPHVSGAGYGWINSVGNDGVAGVIGRGLEAVTISVPKNIDGGIEYEGHVQSVGWQDYVSDGKVAGTTGMSKKLQAIRINLTGNIAKQYDIYYRAYVENEGWLNWAKNGEIAGTTGYGKNLNAIQVKVVRVGEAGPEGNGESYKTATKMTLKYSPHVAGAGYGWQNYVEDGTQTGIIGRNIEALKIKIDNKDTTGSIQYQAHVGGYGWKSVVGENQVGGSTGESREIQAINIKLTGGLAKNYDIYYRVYVAGVEGYTWLGWAKNGENAGTISGSKPIQNVQIKLVKKTESFVDDGVDVKFMDAIPVISYDVYNNNWTNTVKDGNTAGSTSGNTGLKALKINMISQMYKGNINYQIKTKNADWQSASNGAVVGDISSSDVIEAIKINIDGTLNNYYSVYYRVYIDGIGWLDWTKDGEIAGTDDMGGKIEAVQIKFALKNSINTSGTSYLNADSLVTYSPHISGAGYGWQNFVNSGTEVGIDGRNIEAIKVKVNNKFISGGITYRAHVSGIGWQSYVSNGAVSGTTGQSRGIQAVSLKLTGDIAKKYDIYYRVSIPDRGYLGWAKNGEDSGTISAGININRLQIRIVTKDYKLDDNDGKLAFMDAKPSVSYSVKTTNTSKTRSVGTTWMTASDGVTAGSIGSKIQGLYVSMKSDMYDGNITFDVREKDGNWLGEHSGTFNFNRDIDAIKIKLSGEVANHYNVYYKVYITGRGWLGWAENGEDAGIEKIKNAAIEAIQIEILDKAITVNDLDKSYLIGLPSVTYQVHVGGIGWQDSFSDGEMAGTTGQSRNIEAIKIDLADNGGYDGGIQYEVNVGRKGWQSAISNGKEAGTTGQSKKLEGIKIKLTGEIADYYDIYYRVHVGSFGWFNWAKNGETAGTSGAGVGLQAINIVLVKKGDPVPGTTGNTYKEGHWGDTVALGVIFRTYTDPLGRVANDFKYIDGKKYFFNSLGYLVVENARRIIDVSSHNGVIDWNQVKNSGVNDEKDEVDGAIVRVGSWLQKGFDTQLPYNISELNRLGIPYGIYLYSYAVDGSEDVPALGFGNAHCGYLDAWAINKAINDYGMNLSYPIYYDLESNGYNSGWTWNNYRPIIDRFADQMNAYSIAYAGTAKSSWFKNWQIYTGPAWSKQTLTGANSDIINRITWVAHYNHYLKFNMNNTFNMWQYTSSDRLPGISTNVDSSVYGDFPHIFAY